MKQQVSHRLDSELLAWATEYGEVRGTSRAVVIEEALRHFRGLAQGGVPDLPAPDTPEVREQRVQAVKPQGPPAEPTYSQLLGSRQARLNAMIDKARGVK